MKSMYDVKLKGKTVLVRIDLNTTIKRGPVINERFREHAKTVKDLIKAGAKIVLLAHQGRPGKKDFTSLRKHATLLSKLVKKNVGFVPDLYGDKAIEKIKSLKEGEVLLLENVRFYEDEFSQNPRKTKFVKRLQPLIDYFILDAFSVCHRKQTSVVGFRPAIAGRVLLEELNGLKKLKKIKHPYIIVVGGGKIKEPLELISSLGKDMDLALVGGVTALALMRAQGFGIGPEDDKAKKVLKKFEDKILLPLDLVSEKGTDPVYDLKYENYYDIGPETIRIYTEKIKTAKTILLAKPMGVYEKKKFETGTKKIFSAVANSKAKKFAGGGDTITALKKFKIPLKKFDHVSLGGGAFLEFVSGKKLPGLKVVGFYG